MFRYVLTALAVFGISGCGQPDLLLPSPSELTTADKKMTNSSSAYVKKPDGYRLRPVSFSDLPNWRADNHKAAFETFLVSCRKIMTARVHLTGMGEAQKPKSISTACRHAVKFMGVPERDVARLFFETYFQPHKVDAPQTKGLFTGYYEPELEASRVKTKRFHVPIYRRPQDLITLEGRTESGKALEGLTAGRKGSNGIEPYYTREEIDKGALDGQGLEMLYLDDAVDAFFLQIQGSGRIKFPDGQISRINFAARNGHPYGSIGKYMIAQGMIPEKGMSLEAIKNFIRADIKNRHHVLWQNKSYIFFRELSTAESKDGPMGAMGVPLTAGRSLAVDTRYHDLGTPIYAVASSMKHHGQQGFHRLMVAQDVGSAIKGPERGDIYWGTGDKAGHIAGNTGNAGQYFVLLPK